MRIDCHNLSGDSYLTYIHEFLHQGIADAMYEVFRDKVGWHDKKISDYVEDHIPRLVAWYGEKGVVSSSYTITCGTKKRIGLGFPSPLLELKNRVEETLKGIETFNSVSLNLYRDENDSVGFHTDQDKELGPRPVIATVSLGVRRRMVLRNVDTRQDLYYTLDRGSLVVMSGYMQTHWTHAIPRPPERAGARISLVFRNIKKEFTNRSDAHPSKVNNPFNECSGWNSWKGRMLGSHCK